MKGRRLNEHLRRYWLPNGWFMDYEALVGLRWAGQRYTIWEPGGDPSGCAAYRGGGNTQAEALATIAAVKGDT